MAYRKIGLPDSQLHIYESKHSPGERVTPHHHDVYEILFVLDGEGSIQLEGENYNVHRDRIVFIAPNSEHAVYAKSKMTVLVLAFGDFLNGMPGKDTLFERALSKSKYAMLDNMSANELRESFRKILYEQNKGDILSTLAAKNHLLHALLVIARVLQVDYYADSNAYRANVLKHIIDTRYFERLTAESLASMLKLTSRHMNDIFKQEFQMTPVQYLTDVRVKHAKELLVDTDKEIVSICFEVGFETLSTFYRSFKRKVGISPQQFRRQL